MSGSASVRVGAIATALVLAAALGPAAMAQGAAAPNVSGVWWASAYSPKIPIQGGGEPPLTAAGKAQYTKNIAGLKDGSIADEARRVCTPDGVPRILSTPYPFEIVHSPGQTTILHELNHVIRTVAMDKPQLSKDELELIPYYSGHSVGHWDGDTLVVESGGFKENTFLDATGLPHSDQMSTVERIRKINGGKQLEDVVTITDPATYTKPWSARYVYDAHPEVRLEDDYLCGEPHRDISHIAGVTQARQARTR